MTNYVSTRWYRAPECLLSSRNYGKPADVFALGCIFAEFIKLKPLFNGESSLDQLRKYCAVLGSPSEEDWPEGHLLSEQGSVKLPDVIGTGLANVLPEVSFEALDLMMKMLQLNPDKRPTMK